MTRSLRGVRAAGFERRVRDLAMAFPEAHEDFPWGETVVKVRTKVFVFLGASATDWGFSVKLPQSAASALEEGFCEPTGYGLGKAGWVSARYSPSDDPDFEQIARWIGESYRAVAPRTLVKALDGGAAADPTNGDDGVKPKAPSRATAAKSAATKSTTVNSAAAKSEAAKSAAAKSAAAKSAAAKSASPKSLAAKSATAKTVKARAAKSGPITDTKARAKARTKTETRKAK